MPQAPPVFFLSFANNDKQSFLNLKEEGEIIYNLLLTAENEQRIKIHREPFATIRNTTKSLNDFADRIVLFHYGGHASSKTLIFNDQAANATGFAQQLAQQPALKLVILNGCSTQEQVKLLLDLGIPAVIATSNPIPDKQAIQFSEAFYSALVAGKKLKKAFKSAAAVMETMSGQQPAIIYRDAGLRSNVQKELPWGLYVNKKKVLKERLIPVAVLAGIREKNIINGSKIKVKGNAQIGDKGVNDKEIYHRKNVIEGSDISVGGDFTLGDK